MKEKRKTLLLAVIVSLIVTLLFCSPYILGTFTISSWGSSDGAAGMQGVMGGGYNVWEDEFFLLALFFTVLITVTLFTVLTIALYFIIDHLKRKKSLT